MTGVPQEYIDFSKDALIKSNARRFETLGALTNMLDMISSYNLPVDYVKGEEAFIKSLTIDSHKAIAEKYLNPKNMYFLVVGDAATQLKELEKAGLGKPVLINN